MKLDKNLNLIVGPTKEYLARQQRAMGCSLKDISKELDIPVTSLRRLCEDIKLTDEQKKNLLHKRKRQILKIDYENNNIKIKGKIIIQISKKQLFDEQKLINDIINLIRIQSQNTCRTFYHQTELE